ncbi:MAG TPA: DUF1761 domain-containing protein, partial [Chitinophagales bacterium]|nr:DUF1761 domain-containing protein [Chitinophagales bacterium]
GTAWMKHAGMTEERIKSGNMVLIFGLSFLFSVMLAMAMNTIAYHDVFVKGALYYITDHTMAPDPASEAGKWLEYYMTNLSASNRTLQHGAFHGFFIAGLLIALPVLATNALFERKSFKYVLVNGGYWMLALTIMGAIVAAWK